MCGTSTFMCKRFEQHALFYSLGGLHQHFVVGITVEQLCATALLGAGRCREKINYQSHSCYCAFKQGERPHSAPAMSSSPALAVKSSIWGRQCTDNMYVTDVLVRGSVSCSKNRAMSQCHILRRFLMWDYILHESGTGLNVCRILCKMM